MNRNLENRISSELNHLREIGRYRELKSPSGIDFSSNDYLNLSRDPDLKNAMKEGIDLYGLGSTASRLIRGHRDIYESLEEKMANFVGSETSLFLANGFLANLGLIQLLGQKDSLIFCDRLNHASIIDGTRLSEGKVRYYRHCDTNHLESLLRESGNDSEKIVITESLFSMDGDFAPLNEILNLKEKYDFTLIVDEAHALGVFGIEGIGLAGTSEIIGELNSDSKPHIKNILSSIDIRIYTAGKSMGLEGAFIACSHPFKDYLINKLRTFIFSTAPIPAIAHALHKSIDLIRNKNDERIKIVNLSNYFREEIQKKGYDTLESRSQIIPVLCASDHETMELSRSLQKNGYDIRGIRPPTVKVPRLRISINSQVKIEDINGLLSLFSIRS
ncbi:MAG: 8-amino-7-oxononanoate synthase [Leptospiraceae bacterium]|nr:8-amino-7-oxononanoate synthase [Leptospiraceae bacterium]MCP5510386.1 8-amino-7-oxononanoate synthase [Leptospiraceae bacterium]